MQGIKINRAHTNQAKTKSRVVEALSRPERPAADWGQVLESKDKPCTVELFSQGTGSRNSDTPAYLMALPAPSLFFCRSDLI